MQLASCPPPTALVSLFLGGLPEAEVSALEEHVLVCGGCLAALKRVLPADNTVAGNLEEETPAPLVNELIQKLKSMGPGHSAGGAPAEGSAQPAATPPPPAKSDRETTQDGEPPQDAPDNNLTGLLAPPQAADEQGRLGPYRVLRLLGHGGMGVVFLAEDTRLKRKVALKAMLPGLAASASAARRFRREAEAMAAVEHDHVVRIYQVDEDRGVPFLAMEFLEGESLEERLKREAPLTLPEGLRITREIAEGLEAAHARGLIHRDIKPANVFLQRLAADEHRLTQIEQEQGNRPPDLIRVHPCSSVASFRVKILDFGLARAAVRESGVTQQGAIVGTPAYMAPEQARGEPVDARSDLFSLGVVMYRLCCGRQPFGGKDAVATLLSVATDEPPAPIAINAELPPELSGLVLRLLEKAPARRPSSATEVVRALQALEQRVPRAQSESLPLQKAAVPVQRGRLPVLIGMMVVAGVVGLGLWASDIFRFPTEPGELVLESDDPDFTFSPVSGGSVALEDRKANRTYTVRVVPLGRDRYQLAVRDRDADLVFHTETLTVQRGDRVALKAWFERKPAAQAPDTWAEQLAAAQWVIDRKGTVTILREGRRQSVNSTGAYGAVKSFPPGPLAIVGLYLGRGGNRSSDKLADADLARLAPLRDLEELDLRNQSITAASLAHLAPLAGLRRLNLMQTYMAPAEGARAVRAFPKLEYLNTAADWVEHLAGTPSLRMLEFRNAGAIADDVMGRFKDIPNLACLSFWDSSPGAAGLLSLKEVRTLRLLLLRGVKVEEDVLRGLAKEMPECEVRQLDRKPAFVLNVGKGAALYSLAGVTPSTNPQSQGPASEEDWVRQVTTLPLKQQFEAVIAKLKERNPGFDGKVGAHQDNGVVTTLDFLGNAAVSDLAPLRATTGLQKLNLSYTQVADLAPLEGLPLTALVCRNTPVSDLSPLKPMRLTALNICSTEVTDLTPLQGMPLTDLDLEGLKISDLTALKGMPLTRLILTGTQVVDLSQLKDMQLTELSLSHLPVSDLTPFKGMPLTTLALHHTAVTDLSPLKGMKLTRLYIPGAKVTDLSLLKAMPLVELSCDFQPERDAPILRAIQTLKHINDKPAEEFWQQVRP